MSELTLKKGPFKPTSKEEITKLLDDFLRLNCQINFTTPAGNKIIGCLDDAYVARSQPILDADGTIVDMDWWMAWYIAWWTDNSPSIRPHLSHIKSTFIEDDYILQFTADRGTSFKLQTIEPDVYFDSEDEQLLQNLKDFRKEDIPWIDNARSKWKELLKEVADQWRPEKDDVDLKVDLTEKQLREWDFS